MRDYTDNAKGLLKDFPTLTEYEALIISLEEERNKLIKEAFGVSSDNSYPRFLEGIGIALGLTNDKIR